MRVTFSLEELLFHVGKEAMYHSYAEPVGLRINVRSIILSAIEWSLSVEVYIIE
jgi:hypothetical protein